MDQLKQILEMHLIRRYLFQKLEVKLSSFVRVYKTRLAKLLSFPGPLIKNSEIPRNKT